MPDMTPEQETIWLSTLEWLRLGIKGDGDSIDALSDSIIAFVNQSGSGECLFAIATIVMTSAEIMKEMKITADEFERLLVDPMSMHILNWSYKE